VGHLFREGEVIGDAEHLKALSALPEANFEFRGLCVYFLWLGDALQYVGQSAYLHSRINQHERARDGEGAGKRIPFDRCTFMEVDFDDMDRIETEHIEAYWPPFNELARTNFKRPRYINMPGEPR
jgi:hypothetical protein